MKTQNWYAYTLGLEERTFIYNFCYRSNPGRVETEQMLTSISAAAGVKAGTNYFNSRANGQDCDSPHAAFPKDGRISGSNPVRYDEGISDSVWMEKRDRNYLARIQLEGKLRDLEPGVWCLREMEHAQGMDIGDWWSKKLPLPNIAEILQRAQQDYPQWEAKSREAQEQAAREAQEQAAREAQEQVAREAQEQAAREAQEQAAREAQEQTEQELEQLTAENEIATKKILQLEADLVGIKTILRTAKSQHTIALTAMQKKLDEAQTRSRTDTQNLTEKDAKIQQLEADIVGIKDILRAAKSQHTIALTAMQKKLDEAQTHSRTDTQNLAEKDAEIQQVQANLADAVIDLRAEEEKRKLDLEAAMQQAEEFAVAAGERELDLEDALSQAEERELDLEEAGRQAEERELELEMASVQAQEFAVHDAQELSEREFVTEVGRCALSGILMFDPVLASDGETYEREEIENRLDLKILSTNNAIKRIIVKYLLTHPKLWQSDEIYFSEKLKQHLLTAVRSHDAEAVAHIVKQDPRLLTRELDNGKTLLTLALSEDCVVLQTVVHELGAERLRALPEIATDDGMACFRAAATHLATAGARIIAEALTWSQVTIQVQFSEALTSDDLNLVSTCLDLGANLEDVDLEDPDDMRPLNWAVDNGSDDLVRLLVVRGADRSAPNYDGNTALHLAVINGDLEAVRILCEPQKQAAAPEAVESEATAAAPESIEPESIEPEIASPALANLSPVLDAINLQNQLNALQMALNNMQDNPEQEVHFAIIQLLIEAQANLELPNAAGDTPLLQAIRMNHLCLGELLLNRPQQPANPEAREQNGAGFTALHLALELGNREFATKLLQAGANVEAVTPSENDTPLLHTIRSNKPELLALLLAHQPKPDLEKLDRAGNTALHLAFNLGFVELIPQLVNAGANLESKDQDGNTALLRAVRARRLDLILEMLGCGEHSADINAVNNAAENALHLAFNHADENASGPCLNLNFELLIPRLIKAGIDLEFKDPHGNTALLRAVMAKKLELVKQMLEHGKNPAEINAVNSTRENALHIVARQGDTQQDHDIAIYLLEHGIDGSALNAQGKKPQKVASKASNPIMAQLIEEKIDDLRMRRLLQEHLQRQASPRPPSPLAGCWPKSTEEQRDRLVAQGTPEEFICSIKGGVMCDPVIDRKGHTFERVKIEEWLRSDPKHTCPLGRESMMLTDLAPNRNLRESIEKFFRANPAMPREAAAAAPSEAPAAPPGSEAPAAVGNGVKS